MSVELEQELIGAPRQSLIAPSQKPWRRVFIEGLTIVASILLAFGIDAWWDGRQDEFRRRQLLEDLRADFSATQQLLADVLASAPTVVARSQGFVKATSDAAGLSPDSIGVLASGLFTEISFTPAISHYKASVATGDIGLIRSDSLLVFLNRFDLGLQRFQLHDQIQAELFYLGAIQELRRKFGTVVGFAADNSPERTRRIHDPAVSAAAEPVAIVQENIVEAIHQMVDATDLVLRELDRLQKAR